MKKEKVYLSEEDLENFDITATRGKWYLKNETYIFIDEIRTDEYSDGESWDTVVQRESDKKFFKWNCWEGGNSGYQMEDGENYMTEVKPKVISKTIYK